MAIMFLCCLKAEDAAVARLCGGLLSRQRIHRLRPRRSPRGRCGFQLLVRHARRRSVCYFHQPADAGHHLRVQLPVGYAQRIVRSQRFSPALLPTRML